MRPHVRFEWDEAKRRSNLWRHGIDFAEVAEVFAAPVLFGTTGMITGKSDILRWVY